MCTGQSRHSHWQNPAEVFCGHLRLTPLKVGVQQTYRMDSKDDFEYEIIDKEEALAADKAASSEASTASVCRTPQLLTRSQRAEAQADNDGTDEDVDSPMAANAEGHSGEVGLAVDEVFLVTTTLG